MHFLVAAEYRPQPTEGINVVSKTIIDDLRTAGHRVSVVEPTLAWLWIPILVLGSPDVVVFTHGPGVRTVLVSRLMRILSKVRIIWVATRPDVERCPTWLRGGRSAHVVVCNRPRRDLEIVALDAHFIEQPIGIAPERVRDTTPKSLFQEIGQRGVPVAAHVGHLRPSRGLEQLVAIKRRLGRQIEIVVVASPYFSADPAIVGALTEVGIRIIRDVIPNIADVYRSADVYLFPVPPEQHGAIELPLSVLEAIACETPVISTPFGVLPRTLRDMPGVTFAGPDEFVDAVEHWVTAPTRVRPAGLPNHLNAHQLAEIIAAHAP